MLYYKKHFARDIVLYEFSVPMPFCNEHTDKLIEINSKLKKSQITSLYFAMPSNCSAITGFESLRTTYKENTNFEYWKDKIVYAKEKGFDFIYLLNNPRSTAEPDKVLNLQLERLDKLINNLRKINCKKLRVGSIQLINYILRKYPDMEIYASTTLEFDKIQQFQTFYSMYPSVKEIVPSFEANKNFKLLKNLKKQFPNVTIELMVNEGCVVGCPNRIQHCISFPFFSESSLFSQRSECFEPKLFLKKCSNHINSQLALHICQNKQILPWEIEKYANIGITNFKLVGRNHNDFSNGSYFNSYKIYLTAIEDYDKVKNLSFSNLSHHISTHDLPSMDKFRKYLPKIEHFIKNGHLCSSICGNECNYCKECAKNLDKYVLNNN